MIVRQTITRILPRQLMLFLLFLTLLSRHVAAISLSQFQQISGFSNSCEDVWAEDIPGCAKSDFATSNSCSRNCLAGVNIINAEVLVACADARVSSNTLLGEFLSGFGVSALCGSSTGSTTSTVTTSKSTSTTSTKLTSVQSTTTSTTSTTSTTAVQDTTTSQSSTTSSTTESATSTSSSTSSSITTSSSTTTSIPNVTISFTGSSTTTTSTSSVSSTSTTTSAKSTASSDPEAKGFGGVGDAFDILGGESAGCRLDNVSLRVMGLLSILVIAMASRMW